MHSFNQNISAGEGACDVNGPISIVFIQLWLSLTTWRQVVNVSRLLYVTLTLIFSYKTDRQNRLFINIYIFFFNYQEIILLDRMQNNTDIIFAIILKYVILTFSRIICLVFSFCNHDLQILKYSLHIRRLNKNRTQIKRFYTVIMHIIFR